MLSDIHVKKQKPLGKKSVFPFGKHKGQTIGFVIDTDPGYIDWCCKNIPDFKLNNYCKRELELSLESFAEDENLNEIWGNGMMSPF